LKDGDAYLGGDPPQLLLEGMCEVYGVRYETSDPMEAPLGSAPGMTMACGLELRDAIVRAEGGDPKEVWLAIRDLLDASARG
jgi:hypothetical protein